MGNGNKESVILKKNLMDLAVKQLCNCEVFQKNIGGEKFINNQFKKYLDKVYIGPERSDEHMGEYRMGENSIVIFTRDEKEILNTSLHEAIHCILTRKNGKDLSTGIENVKNNLEIGRSLNEGLTEWIVDKAGLSGNSYTIEKNIIKQLELALGESNVMKFARGDIKREIPRLLGTSKIECRYFLREVDMLSNLRSHYLNKCSVLKSLNNNTPLDEMLKKDTYKRRIEDNEYSDYLKELNIDDSRESQINFFIKLKDHYLNNYCKMEYEIQNQLFNKYFKKEFDGLENKKKFTVQQSKNIIKKYDDYFRIRFDGNFFRCDKQEFNNEIEGLRWTRPDYEKIGFEIVDEKIDLIEKYSNLREKLYQPIKEETINKLKKNDISSKDFDENMRILTDEEPRKEIAKEMLPANSENVEKLSRLLRKKNPSRSIINSAFYKIKSKDDFFDIFLDGDLNQISLQDASESRKKLINFTTPMGCSYQKIIDNFDNFINDKKVESPDAKIKVCSQCIIIFDKGKKSFYAYNGENIEEAEVVKEEKVNVNFKEEKSLMVIPENKGLFTRISELVKRKNIKKITTEKSNVLSQSNVRELFMESLKLDNYNQDDKNINNNLKDKTVEKENRIDDVER